MAIVFSPRSQAEALPLGIFLVFSSLFTPTTRISAEAILPSRRGPLLEVDAVCPQEEWDADQGVSLFSAESSKTSKALDVAKTQARQGAGSGVKQEARQGEKKNTRRGAKLTVSIPKQGGRSPIPVSIPKQGGGSPIPVSIPKQGGRSPIPVSIPKDQRERSCGDVHKKAEKNVASEGAITQAQGLLLLGKRECRLLPFAQLSKDHPRWWGYFPKTMNMCQGIAEEVSLLSLSPASRILIKQNKALLVGLFRHHPPRTQQGWQLYKDLLSPSGPYGPLSAGLAPDAPFALRKERALFLESLAAFWLSQPIKEKDFQAFWIFAKKNLPFTVFSRRLVRHLWQAGRDMGTQEEALWRLWLDQQQEKEPKGSVPGQEVTLWRRALSTLMAWKKNPEKREAFLASACANLGPNVQARALLVALNIAMALKYRLSGPALKRVLSLWQDNGLCALAQSAKDPTMCTSLKRWRIALVEALWDHGRHEENASPWCYLALKVADACPLCPKLNRLRGLIYAISLNEPLKAVPCFLAMVDAPHKSPSEAVRAKVRAWAWAGLCYKQAKMWEKAKVYLEKAASQPSVFYGQLATFLLNRPLSLHFYKGKGAWTRAPLTCAERILTLWRQSARAHNAFTRLAFLDDVEALCRTPGEKKYYLAHVADVEPHLVCTKAKGFSYASDTLFYQAYPFCSLPTGVKDPAWIYAIILAESSFHPKSHSRPGAKGLLQTLSSTAAGAKTQIQEQISGKKYHVRGAESMDLNHPLTPGIYLFHHMLARYKTCYPLALAAYNAGDVKVGHWRALVKKDAPRPWHWVESLTYGETRSYVFRVLENYIVYRWLLKNPVTCEDVVNILRLEP